MDRNALQAIRHPRAIDAAAGRAFSWDRRRAAHLVRRTGFGAIKREVDTALNDGSPETAVDHLLASAVAEPLPDPPEWYAGSSSTNTMDRIYDIQRRWLDEMRTKGLREKMALFWHNHFVVGYPSLLQKSPAPVPNLCYDYLTTLRRRALGNFKTLVHDIGLNPAMLVYLDGFVNESRHANENFGRELLELFTMGQFDAAGEANYDEGTIKEVARALTGWTVTSRGAASFDPSRHDTGVKSFFGRSGAFRYDDVVDILFETRGRQIAEFICRKIYCFFVEAVPDADFVSELAAELLARNFEIAPVLRRLLTSDHFYRDTFVASRIKSPVEMLVGFLREAEVKPTTDLLEMMRERLIKLNQEILSPPNVAGWPGLNPPGSDGLPGHRTWLTTSTLPDRWSVLEDLIHAETCDPVQLAAKISDPSNPFRMPTDLAEMLLAVPLEFAGIRQVVEALPGSSEVPPPPSFLSGPGYSINLTKILLGSIPHYEWPSFRTADEARRSGAWTPLVAFASYLLQLPEYQLT